MKLRPGVFLTVVFVLGVGLYSVTFDYEYTWDDQLFYEQSPRLAQLANIKTALSVDYWGLVTHPGSPDSSPYYRPLALAFIVFERSLLGTSPLAFRLVHTAVHLINVLLLFFLVRRVLGSPRGESYGVGKSVDGEGNGAAWGAVFAAAFFAFLPYGVDTVLFLTSICDLLATSFFLAACLAFVSYIHKGRWYHLAFVFISSLLSVSSKEHAVTLSLCLATLSVCLAASNDQGSWGKAKWRRGWTGVMTSVLGAMIFLIARYGIVGGFGSVSLAQWLLWLPKDLVVVLRWAVAPVGLVLEQPVARQLDLLYGVGCGAIVLGIALLVIGIRRFPKVIMGMVIFCLTALPSLVALQLTGVFAPRYLYLPAVGLGLILGYLVSISGPYLKGALVLLLVLGLYLSLQRVVEWQDRVTLFAMEIGRVPESYTALNNLGNIFAMAGETDKAIEFQVRAARVAEKRQQKCKAAFAYSNVANLLGQQEEAVDFFRRSTGLCPERAQNAWYGLARLFAAREQWREAEAAAFKALEVGPKRAEIFAQASLIATVLGKDREAERYRGKALGLAGQGSKLAEDLERRLQAASRYRDSHDSP